MIDTRTHNLKRDPGGEYRVGQKSPCGHCGHLQTCPVQPRQVCKDFLPVLSFQDDVGLHDYSNTIRVGQAWMFRLQFDQTVALYSPKTTTIFGHAKVKLLAFGPIRQMLNEHAATNHTMLTTPQEDAPRALGLWLRRNYGPRIINPATSLTAIYVQRIDGSHAPPSVEGDEADRTAEGITPVPGEDHGDGEGRSPTDR